MKLIVDLNNGIQGVNYGENDIVITNQDVMKYKCRTLRTNFSLCDENQDLSKSINDLFDNYLPMEFGNFRNTYFMRVFRPICSVILQIEELLNSEPITELVLVGGSSEAFITLNGGEGEGEKFLYKSSWLFNDFIYQYFNKTIPIRWGNKNNKLIFSLFHIVRENIFFYIRSIKNLIQSTRLKNTLLKQKKGQPNIFSFVNLPLQYRHLTNLTIDLKKHNKCFITAFNSKILQNKDEGILAYKITLKEVVIAFRKYKKLKTSLTRGDLIFYFNNNRILLPKTMFIRSFKLNFILFESKLSGLKDLFKNYIKTDKSCFITDMTFGEDIILVNECSKIMNIPHYNFQIVGMSKMLFPQMNLANRYFLFSKKTLQLFQKYNSTYEYYLPNFKNDIVENCGKGEVLTLSIFTQPDTYTEKYLKFLNGILPLIDKIDKKIKVLIKPHYRQNRINEFEELAKMYKNVEIRKNSETAENVIEQSDFVLSMTSAILFETVTLNRPGIIINMDPLDDKIIYENDICCPEINFVIKSTTELMGIINNSDRFSVLYKERRETWLLDNKNINLSELFDVG